MKDKTYSMEIAGLKRELPLCSINDKIDIAAFIIFGDVELTVAASAELLKKAPDFDVIITPEAKSIPLAYEMSRQSGKPYVVARKKVKLYMRKCKVDNDRGSSKALYKRSGSKYDGRPQGAGCR